MLVLADIAMDESVALSVVSGRIAELEHRLQAVSPHTSLDTTVGVVPPDAAPRTRRHS